MCSEAYCLRTINGHQKCRFGFPKSLQQTSVVEMAEDGTLALTTARNDPLVNSYSPIQLFGWRANVDMQYCVSRNKVVQYIAKYATKSETRSESLKDIYSTIVRGFNDDDRSLKAIQKLLIKSLSERDYSAQETCHLLLQLPMNMSTREFVILSLDGSRQLRSKLNEENDATVPSAVDKYMTRPASAEFENMTLLTFVQDYNIVKSGSVSKRRNSAVAIVRPHLSCDPCGNHFEQYCVQRLMLHIPFRNFDSLKNGNDSFSLAYAEYLKSGKVPSCLEDDIQRVLQENQCTDEQDDVEDSPGSYQHHNHSSRFSEEWMILCSQHPVEEVLDSESTVDWNTASQCYPNIEEAHRFITSAKESNSLPRMSAVHSSNQAADPMSLHGNQKKAYEDILKHYQCSTTQPLRLIISGTAGTGKSYLIHCIRKLLQEF